MRANGFETYWIWKLIFARSNGAITVLATPPAIAPQNKFITTVFTFDGIESENRLFFFFVSMTNRKTLNNGKFRTKSYVVFV